MKLEVPVVDRPTWRGPERSVICPHPGCGRTMTIGAHGVGGCCHPFYLKPRRIEDVVAVFEVPDEHKDGPFEADDIRAVTPAATSLREEATLGEQPPCT